MSIWSGTYSRLPHGIFDTDVALAVGEKALWTLLRMSDFCDRNSTDGVVSDRQLLTFCSPPRARSVLPALELNGLIKRAEHVAGWELIGWLDGHRSAAEKEELARNRRSAGRKGGKASAKARASAEANAQQDVEQVAEGLLNPEQGRAEQIATEPPRSTQEGPSTGRRGGGGDSPASIIGDADVELGLANPPIPTAGELRTVTAALARGWTPHDLTALATTAAHRTDIDRPRAWVHAAWARMANTDPEHADVIDLAGRRPGPLPRHHPPDCPGQCSDEGWIDLPDGSVAKCTGQPIEAQQEVTG